MKTLQSVLAAILLTMCYFVSAADAQTKSLNSSASTQPLPGGRYGDLPLAFEPNQGQAPSDVRFVSRAQGMTVFLRDDEATLVGLSSHKDAAVVRMRFVGGSFHGKPVASQTQLGVSNYLLGDKPENWRTGIPNFGRVRYAGIYKGIDLVLYGNHRQLEHDFVLVPGADYHQIRVRLEDATNLTLQENGVLRVATASGAFTFKAPQIYQQSGNKKLSVKGEYDVTSSNEFGFRLGNFDRNLPLVIDPVLAYSTFLGGSTFDGGTGIAIDSSGNAFVTGYTASIDFPVENPEQGTCANICNQADVFVTKLNTTGSALVYSTFIGGSGDDRASSIAVDSLGNASVAGGTSSFDFPQKNGITVVLSTNSQHAFVLSLNPAGSALNFSTYLGGESYDFAYGVENDPSGNVYVSGTTSSTFFPVTSGNQIGPAPSNGSNDVFVAKFGLDGKLAFSTLIGGDSLNFPGTFGYGNQTPFTLAVDSAGEAIVAGSASDGLPTTAGSYEPDYPGVAGGGGQVAFLTKLNSTGSAILYGTYLGSSNGSFANGVALDSTGNIFITGTTSASDFPTTPGSFQPANSPGSSQRATFVSKFDPTLSTLAYSTYLGATNTDSYGGISATGIAVDFKGNAHIAGSTTQPYLPLVSPVMGTTPQNIYGNINGAFLSVLNPSGSALIFSTFFGGSTNTSAAAVAVGLAGNPFITGITQDTDLPTTAKAFQPTFPGTQYQQHAFVTKFVMSTANAAACFASGTLYLGTVQPGQSTTPIPLTLTNCGTLPLKVSSVTTSNSSFVVAQNGCSTVAAGATCTIKVRYSPTVVGVDIGALKVNDNAPVTPQSIQLTGSANIPNLSVYATDITMPDGVVGVKGFPVQIELVSNSGIPVHITKVTASGDFSVSNPCPAAMYAGDFCYLPVTFTPKAAGLRTGTLTIYDDAFGNPQTVSLKGAGLAKYPVPAINFLFPGSAAVGSGAASVFVEGTNFFPNSKVTLNGAPAQFSGSSGYFQVTIPASLTAAVGNISVQVVNPTPGGGASAPWNFAVYKQISLGAADAIFEPFTRKFYASIPASATTNPNSLVTVDPVTYAVGAAIPIGNDPGALGLSTDGTILYVALNGNNSIVPFNLLTQKKGVEIPLGSDGQKGPLNATNIQVQPDHPTNLVAALTSQFQGADGLDWIKSGKVVTQFLNEPPTNEAIGGTKFVGANDVYAWSANYGAMGIEHFVVTATNLLEAPGFTGQYGIGAFDSDGKNLYDVNGQVFDAGSGAIVGNLAGVNSFGNPGVLTENNSGRTFLLDQYAGISVFDSNSLAFVGSTNFSNLYNLSNRLQHWGANGLSFLTSNSFNNVYDLVLLRSSWLYPSAGPNPLPVLTSVSPSPVASKGSNFLLTVNGSKFTRGAVVQWNGVTRTTKWVSASKLVADIQASEIKAAGTAKITVVNPGPSGGPSVNLNLTVK